MPECSAEKFTCVVKRETWDDRTLFLDTCNTRRFTSYGFLDGHFQPAVSCCHRA